MNKQINTIAESLRADLIAFLRDIIAIPSITGGEDAVIHRIRQEMESIGYDRVWTDSFGNLIGTIGSGPRIIALDGHCDTVDTGNPDTWEIDPFKGDHRNKTIYGRGASDQKGGLASAVYAGKILKETGIPSNTTLLVTASVLEEDFEGLCWHHILTEGEIRPHAVLLTEPSDLRIMTGQRGRMEMKINVQGISCHGSAPERGENAIYKLAPIIREIEELNHRLHSPSVLGKGSVTVTDVKSAAPSLCAVPDSAVLHLDRRLTEGENMDSAAAEIANLPSVKAAHARVSVPEYQVRSYTGLVAPTKAYFPMWLLERAHPVVQAAEKAYLNQFSHSAEVGVWTFSTNGTSTKGAFGIPTIGFGPGKEDHAHTPFDRVDEDDLVKATAFYAAFVREFESVQL
jgi:putative selenium metabolism hydrolase